jgi:hypothetical protein
MDDGEARLLARIKALECEYAWQWYDHADPVVLISMAEEIGLLKQALAVAQKRSAEVMHYRRRANSLAVARP